MWPLKIEEIPTTATSAHLRGHAADHAGLAKERSGRPAAGHRVGHPGAC